MRGVLLRLFSSHYRRQCAITAGLAEEIEEKGLDSMRRRYKQSGTEKRPSLKYLELSVHLAAAVREADWLGLFDTGPKTVLDLGCGPGYFLYTLQEHGHEVMGLDLDEDPMYNELVRLLEIPRVVHRITRFERLPDFDKPFDLITAYSICFNRNNEGEEVWGRDEWSFFIDDSLSRLQPHGRLCLQFNPAWAYDYDFISDDVAEMMRVIPNAKLSASKEILLVGEGPRAHPVEMDMSSEREA